VPGLNADTDKQLNEQIAQGADGPLSGRFLLFFDPLTD